MAIIKVIFLLVVMYRGAIMFFSLLAFWNKSYEKQLPCWQLQHQYIFLFPVFREQDIVVDTLKYYEKFLAYYPCIQLLFVTTAKEKVNPSTQNLIEEFVRQSLYAARIKHICCPEMQGTKATQINFGIDYIRKVTINNPYIVSFDCDARIQWKDFVLADKYISQNPGAAIYSFLPRPLLSHVNSFILRTMILHHGERMLAFEVPSKLHLSINYPMGATMIISPLLWHYLRHIPEPNDDLSLKYILDVYQLKYLSLPYFTRVQAPPDVKNIYRQMIPIFSGVFSYFKTIRSYHGKLTLWRIIKGLRWYLFFTLEYVSILCFLWALLSGDIFFVGLFSLQIVINLIFWQQLSFLNFVLHFFGYFIRLSQFAYFLAYLLVGGPNLCQFKTDRKASNG